ncbi:helix-turn-helix domain-containing protein [Candidatus Poribacteria bacterium]|nr:helix-turn-helix domain-containing protein [Candidatus Poribacteria bacterium]
MLKGFVINAERLRREIVADRKGATIAKELGIDRTYLYRKLGGKIRMTLDDLNRICKVYGRSATEFVDEIDLDQLDLEGTAS